MKATILTGLKQKVMERRQHFSDFLSGNWRKVLYECLLENWHIYAFFAFLAILTVYLRSFGLDYPATGFHNEKEVEWLAVAKDYYLNGFSSCKRILHHEGDRVLPCFENPQLAVISIIAALSWHVFGESIALVRIQMLLFMLGSVFLCYGIVWRISKERVFAATSAIVYTLLPLNIFFGRTINEAAPGNFFMLLSLWLFLLWKDSGYKWRYSIASGFSLALAGMIKFPFVLPAIALLGVFPYKDFLTNFKKRWYRPAGFLIFIVFFVGFILFLQKTNIRYSWRGPIGHWDIVHPFMFLKPSYWINNWHSHKDVFVISYSMLFLYLSFFGFILCLATKNRIRLFLLFYFVAICLTYSIFGHFLKSQNYYSLSFTFGIAIATAYFFYFPLKLIAKKVPSARKIIYVSIFLPFIGYAQINESIIRQFNTQFPGGDIIGKLLAEDKRHPDERVFYYRPHPQTKSLCFYSFMTCTDITRIKKEDFSAFEKKYHVHYLYVDFYRWEELQKHSHWEYIRNNYAVRQIGMRPSHSGLYITYLLLKKGKPYVTPKISADDLIKVSNYYNLRNIWSGKKGPYGFYIANY